jgi:hypothetical protein
LGKRAVARSDRRVSDVRFQYQRQIHNSAKRLALTVHQQELALLAIRAMPLWANTSFLPVSLAVG